MERTVVLTDSQRLKPGNRLVAALPHAVRSGLLTHLKPMNLRCGTTLSAIDEPLRHVYFVETGVVSLVSVFEDGTTGQIVTVGREGVIGIGALLGDEHALGHYVVPVDGFALVMEASRFEGALRESPELRATCEAYAQAFVRHLFQNASCNADHTLEQRCARWLLMCDDQTEDDTFELAQEGLTGVLGVPQSTVGTVVGTLRQSGLINYRCGAMQVLDRPGLEAAACKCYRVVRDGYERALGRVAR